MKTDGYLNKTELNGELHPPKRRAAESEGGGAGRAVEEVLRESEERFRTIFDNLWDGLLLADRETTKFLLGNPAICRMLGYQAAELCQLTVEDIHPNPDLVLVSAVFEKLARKEMEIARDIPVKRKDGSVSRTDSEPRQRSSYMSVASVPLLSRNMIIGVLLLIRKNSSLLCLEKKRVLQSIGRQAGTLIAKMQTEEALRSSGAQLKEQSYQLTIVSHQVPKMDHSLHVVWLHCAQGSFQGLQVPVNI
jgi:PAS domain S-box-containing protein